MSPEGGLLISLTNKSGANSIKGYLVKPSSTTDDAFTNCAVGDPDIIGIVYDNDIADGSSCRIVVSGIAEVYFLNAATHGNFARMCASGDAGAANGKAISEAVPTSPFATDKHFQEIGHIIQTTGGAGLARCVLHFN